MNWNNMDPIERLCSMFINVTFEQALYRFCFIIAFFVTFTMIVAGMIYALIWLYELKTSLGIDIIPGFSFFH